MAIVGSDFAHWPAPGSGYPARGGPQLQTCLCVNTAAGAALPDRGAGREDVQWPRYRRLLTIEGHPVAAGGAWSSRPGSDCASTRS